MYRITGVVFAGIASLAASTFCYAEKPLRSPWDMQKVKVTNVAYACPEPLHLSPDLTTSGFYSDSKSSIIDPVKWKAYTESAGPYKSWAIWRCCSGRCLSGNWQQRKRPRCVLKLEKECCPGQSFHGQDVVQPGVLRAGLGDRRFGDLVSQNTR